ncbi:MAG: metallo-beta-lactamase precursor [Pedosphaera sp.]|nr:metallo-beta-lactamase precursor [Pedosphaera sp.]
MVLCSLLFLVGSALETGAQSTPLAAPLKTNAPVLSENQVIKKMWDAWNAPIKPFRIMGNVYYVGTAGISSFLITTPQGHVLIDTGFEATGSPDS